MLLNGNFESQEWTHECQVFCESGPYDVNIGNVFTPEHWTTWFYHDPGKLDQPEVRDAWKQNDPRRVHEGQKGMLLFTFHRCHDGGFFQQVTATLGKKYRLRAWAHAWSNWQDGPHPSDPLWSEGPGYDAGAIPEGEAPDDNWRNFTFYVGIDPTGGTDPYADSVVWGQGMHIYNVYSRLEVEATAQGDTITVFLRSHTMWPFKHNDAYWDNVTLEGQDVFVPPQPPPDDPPFIEEERGKPRLQYERTYVLLPVGVNRPWALAAVDATWNLHRYTIGSSADDAGVGNLDVRRVIAVNPEEWPGDLEAFFEEHYPDVIYEPVGAASPAELFYALRAPFTGSAGNVWQRHPAWANINLGGPLGTETIGSDGCVLCNICTLVRKLGYDAYPPDLNRLLHEAGVFYDDDIMTWPRVAPLFRDLEWIGRYDRAGSYSAAELQAFLSQGLEVVASLSGKHFVYVVRVEGNNIVCHDPWLEQTTSVRSVTQVTGIRLYQIAGAEPMPPSPEYNEKIRGVHAAPVTSAPGDQDFWLEELKALGIHWYKTMSTDASWLKRVVEAGITPIVRFYQGEQFPDRLAGNLMDLVPGLVKVGVQYFEIGNEPNLNYEWRSEYQDRVSYHDGELGRRLAESWWADAQQVIAYGGKPGFYAMAPTERNGTNPKYSSIHWAARLIAYLGQQYHDEMVGYLRSQQIWVATHTSPFNRPFDFEPYKEGYIDDMCLRGYEPVRDMFVTAFGVKPLMISTEGGCYSPEHLADMQWEPYTEIEWAEKTVQMYDWLARYSDLAGLCTWVLTNEDVADKRWEHCGWYYGKSPRLVAQALRG